MHAAIATGAYVYFCSGPYYVCIHAIYMYVFVKYNDFMLPLMCDNDVNMVELVAIFYHAGGRVIRRDKLSHRGKARSRKADITRHGPP